MCWEVAGSADTMTNTTATIDISTAEGPIDDKYKQLKIISSIVIVAVIILACGIGYLLYRKLCRSHHSKHGVEREEGLNSKGKREYYDQFGVDTNDLTVNSVTAMQWDENEKKPWKVAAAGSGSKSSGIECDVNSSDDAREVQRIDTGKRVFQVNKVSERGAKSTASGQVVIRLHKGFADAARSLQSADGKNYMLALIDKNSKTIHNINLDRNRQRSRGLSPLALDLEEGHVSPHKVATGRKRRRLYSCGDRCQGSAMVHDSPDIARKTRISKSTDELTKDSSNSLTDTSASATSSDEQRRSLSVSSKETDDMDFSAKLLPSASHASAGLSDITNG